MCNKINQIFLIFNPFKNMILKFKSKRNFENYFSFGLILWFIFIYGIIQSIEMNSFSGNRYESILRMNALKWCSADDNRIFSYYCKCEGPQEFPIIVCKNVSNEFILEEVFNKHFNIKNFGKFSLIDSDIKIINNFILPKDKRFKLISIQKTSLYSISTDLLIYSSYYLKRLEIIHNNLETLPFDEKIVFSQLEHLDLYYNSLTSIPDYCFSNSLELKTIDLSFNQISYIGSYAFYLNDKLEYLDLRFNKLKVVNNYAFALKKPNIKLRMDLTHNNMFYLSDGAFENQSPALLNMSVNSLTKFSENHFMPILRAMILLNKRGIVVNSKR